MCSLSKAFLFIENVENTGLDTAGSCQFNIAHVRYLGYTGWAKKSKPAYFCNDFVYCQPISIIFGTYILQEICNQKMYRSPNTVRVTALPCKILIPTLPYVYTCLTTIYDNKYKNICTLDMVHIKKRHNTDYGTLLKCYPWS